MFNLEQAISDWRKQMLAAGIQSPVPLEELEIHLREEIEREINLGLSLDEQEAFKHAVKKLGEAKVLENEFVKAEFSNFERLKELIFTLAGIPNHQLITNMNTTHLNFEPRWVTYSKACVFAFPAIFLWLLTVVFVLPKANQICQQAGTTVFGFESAPMIFKILANVGSFLIFCSHYWFVVGAIGLLMCVLLERFSSQWSRYRRVAIGVMVFLTNAGVLLALALMIISILIVAPALRLNH